MPRETGYVHICRFDATTGKIEKEKTLALVGIADQKISPDGTLLAISSDGKIFLYDMSQLHQVAMLDGGETTEYTFVAFSPDDRFVASSTYDGNVDIWSLHTFERVLSFAAHPGLDLHSSDSIGG
jgi:WD40 repeat protein